MTSLAGKWKLPAWHEYGLCTKDDPTSYDIQTAQQDLGSECARTTALCAGCPVLKECAAEALELRSAAYGCVRGGIPVSTSKGPVGWVGTALKAVAEGATPEMAVTLALPANHLPAFRSAVWARKCRDGTGVPTPSPGAPIERVGGA